MSEAPKKIWADGEMVGESGFASCFDEPMGGEYTEYIRADLVDGLVIALKHWFSSLSDWDQLEDEVKAALKALEEE